MNAENKADVAESLLQCNLKIQFVLCSHSCQIKLKNQRQATWDWIPSRTKPSDLLPQKRKRGWRAGLETLTFSLPWLKMSCSDRDDLEYSLLGDLLAIGFGSSVLSVFY